MASTGDAGTFPSLTRHEDYYINGGDLYILVEHVTFRVHRYFFERESPRFKGQLTIPASPGAIRQGTSDSNAIILQEVRAADFAKFLWVFYNPLYSLYKTSVEDWIIILDLAHRWHFPEVKALCVRELEKLEMPDVERVAVYNKFSVNSNLLIPRYAALCERESPLTVQEGLQLGMAVAIKIASAREHARANPVPPSGARSPTAARLQEDEMHSLIRFVFEIQAPAEAAAVPPTSPTTATQYATGSGSAAAGKPAPILNPAPKPTGANKAPADGSKNDKESTTQTNGSAPTGSTNGADASQATGSEVKLGNGNTTSPDEKIILEHLKALGSLANDSDSQNHAESLTVKGRNRKGKS